MPILVLEGGTKVAEVALFSRDQLPGGRASDVTLSRLEPSGQALRVKTPSNGSYLLYLFDGEEIPPKIKLNCDINDPILYRFVTMSGRIGFGGAESASASFEPNARFRQDARIEAGTYDAVAFHTQYPDGFVEEKVENRIGEDGLKTIGFPGRIKMLSAGATALFLLLSFAVDAGFLVLSILSALAGFIWLRVFTGGSDYKFEFNRKREVELKYPDLVIKMARRSE